MDAHTLDCLEFDRVRELLAGFARSSLGKRLAMSIAPHASAGMVGRWLDQVREMGEVIAEIGAPPFGGVQDVRDAVRDAVPPAKLEPEQLAVIADTLRASARICEWRAGLPATADSLRRIAARIGDHSDVVRRIEQCVDARGEIRDDATERLLRIRREIESCKTQIRVVVDRLLRSSSVVRMLQYASATFHDDRIVLPLKAEHRGRVPGIIHRSSDSGATLFVEPSEAVALNNTIMAMRANEREEVNRILWELTQLVHVNTDAILASLDAMAVLDLIVAKVHFADAYRMRCARISEDGVLRLRDARHPLLMAMRFEDAPIDDVLAAVVPIDVRLGEDFRLLIITGPNTGGKTVTLKTVGLLAIMHQSGLPIPAAEGSCLPVFDRVLVDVGDEQSIQQSLSTFSAHMRHILDVLNRASDRTLVLLDELCAGTDPEEGAAIGRAVLDRLVEIGCRVAISTHLGALKSYAYMTDAAENAAVEFDVATLTPTYCLRIGEPGNSNAIAIAQRLGMSRQLAESARNYLGRQHQDMARAIQKTVDSRRQAESARKAAEEAELDAARRKRDFDAQLEQLRRKEADFEAWRERVTSLQPGDKVRVKRFDRDATVVRLRLQKQQVVVSTGSVEFEVPLAEVILPDADRPDRPHQKH